MSDLPLVSIVLPIHNEAESLRELLPALAAVLDRQTAWSFEVLLVDDVSDDDSRQVAQAMAARDGRFRTIELTRRGGQTGALQAGFEAARGDWLVRMDSDGQDDPLDLPLLLARIEAGADLVLGLRHARKHSRLLRVASILFEVVVVSLMETPLHAHAASFAAFRSIYLKGIPLKRNDHRYLPLIAMRRGGRNAEEVIVRHLPRRFGRSNYRTVRKVLTGFPESLLFFARLFRGFYDQPPAVPAEPPAKAAEPEAIPLCRPSIDEADVAAVADVLRSGWLAHGTWNHRFEEDFARRIGVPHAISMNSCTSALQVALQAAGIRGEVILPSFTFVASVNAVVTAGATPVLCDVDPETRNVTAANIEPLITPSTEAVMIVHYGGQACAMDEIVALCERHGLLLVEDSAEAIGATWQGRQVGSFGIGCFSFFPTKNITTGEGGMLTTSDDAIAQRVRTLIAHGISSTTFQREKSERPWLRIAEEPGYNFRMANPLAALGYHQLQRLESLNDARRTLARRYHEALADLPEVRLPHTMPGAEHVWQMYTIRVPATLRDRLLHDLKASRIGASVHFDPPVHLMPAYRERWGGRPPLPETERLTRELITLPLFPGMSEEEQDRVVGALRDSLAAERNREAAVGD